MREKSSGGSGTRLVRPSATFASIYRRTRFEGRFFRFTWSFWRIRRRR
jgi:hypothetical protein